MKSKKLGALGASLFVSLLTFTLTSCGNVGGVGNSSPRIEPNPTVDTQSEQVLTDQTEPVAPTPPPSSSVSNVKSCAFPVGETIGDNLINYPNRMRVLNPSGSNSSSLLHISLHGAGSTIETHYDVTGLDDVTNLDNGITVYAEKEQKLPWLINPGSTDIVNIHRTIETLHAMGCGSPETTTISGYSMGAMLTSRLICEYPDIAQTIVLVAGALPPTEECDIPGYMKIFIQHGTEDPIVNYDGMIRLGWVRNATGADWQQVDTPGVDKTQVAVLWQSKKGCAYTGNQPEQTPTTSVPIRVDLNTCTSSAPTILVLHGGAGHSWETDNTSQGWTTEQVRTLSKS